VNIVTGAEYKIYENRMMQLGKDIAREFPEINSLLWTVNSLKANIARWDSYPEQFKSGLMNGRDHIHEKLNQYRFRISPVSFFQTNSYQAQILYDTIIEYAQIDPQDNIYDLYCGTGTIAICMSALAKKIVGVESVPNAIEDARFNAELNGITNLEFHATNVEDFMSGAANFDKVIIDPPRAGIHPKSLKGILAMRPAIIIYVSCNPATLARDLAGFVESGSYALERVVAIDMFPHTYHIEAVARLART
jgi:23S rRNA (uracil1939-C5)-methyltransferase